MSKCIKCGRELTSAEIPEFYNGMCEKCYKEQNCAEYPFKQGINDYQNQIDQLRQQLEESFTEEDVNGLIEDRDKTIKFMQKELAEKDCRIEELEGQFAYECECNKQLVDLQKQLEEKQKTIDEINKEFVQAVHDWKALCAEKDKEIECYKNKSYIDMLHKEMLELKLDTQTQLAIQELEKVKEKIDCEMAIREYDISEQTADVCVSIAEQIDQQIKELKGQHND